MFLLKLLTHNLLQRYVAALNARAGRIVIPVTWSSVWQRRMTITIPGRLVQSGRQWTLHVPPSARYLN